MNLPPPPPAPTPKKRGNPLREVVRKKTAAELKDRAITPLWELRARTAGALSAVALAGWFVVMVVSDLNFSGGSTYSAEVCAENRDRLQQTMLRRRYGNASLDQLKYDTQLVAASCN